MKQEKIFTTTEIEKLLDIEFNRFYNNWRRVLSQAEIQSVSQFILQIKDRINIIETNPA